MYLTSFHYEYYIPSKKSKGTITPTQGGSKENTFSHKGYINIKYNRKAYYISDRM